MSMMINSLTKFNLFSKYTPNLKKNLNDHAWKNFKKFDSKFFTKASGSNFQTAKSFSTYSFSKVSNINQNRRLLFKALEKKVQQKQQQALLMQAMTYKPKSFKQMYSNSLLRNRTQANINNAYTKIELFNQSSQFFQKNSQQIFAQSSSAQLFQKLNKIVPMKFKQQYEKLNGKIKYPSYAAAMLAFFYSQAAFSRDFFDDEFNQEKVLKSLETNEKIAEILSTLNGQQKDKIFTALKTLDAEALIAAAPKDTAQLIAIQFLNTFTPCSRKCKFSPGIDDKKVPLAPISKPQKSDETLNTHLQTIIDYFGVGAAFGAGIAGCGSIVAMGKGMTVAAAAGIFGAGIVGCGIAFALYANSNYNKHEKLLQDLCDDYLAKFISKLEIKRA